MEEAVPEEKYTHVFSVAKSIGTGGLAHLLGKHRTTLEMEKVVWLTPLLQVDVLYDYLCKSCTENLLIIGDKDKCFVKERVSELTVKENFRTQIVKGGDHSLERGDGVYHSIDCLKEIMQGIDLFLDE
ncbi:hypothetical protein [Virgibacillus senegalensis]|uniref:hypothetical protein n=1 Tax=Virgibacillus senegalensis TaxID=1499679 RepID=UPI0018FEF96E|nr:hypothetical protein [Virgibacillus senegalensis]